MADYKSTHTGKEIDEAIDKVASITNPMKLKGIVDTIGELPLSAEPGWVYFVGNETDIEFAEYVYTEDGKWEMLGYNHIDLSDYATKTDISEIQNEVSRKVDKVAGKQLSTNDYTNEDKTKLLGLENYDDSEIRADIAALASQADINKATLGYTIKNLLKNALKSQTLSGVTATVNEDGSVTLNGTATTNIFFDIRVGMALESGKKYIINGCPHGGSTSSYALFVEDADSTRSWDFGDGIAFTARNSTYRVAIRINSGYTADNLTFFPMLRYAEITDDTYEPYKLSIEERLAALEGGS